MQFAIDQDTYGKDEVAVGRTVRSSLLARHQRPDEPVSWVQFAVGPKCSTKSCSRDHRRVLMRPLTPRSPPRKYLPSPPIFPPLIVWARPDRPHRFNVDPGRPDLFLPLHRFLPEQHGLRHARSTSVRLCHPHCDIHRRRRYPHRASAYRADQRRRPRALKISTPSIPRPFHPGSASTCVSSRSRLPLLINISTSPTRWTLLGPSPTFKTS